MNYWELTLPEQIVYAAAFARFIGDGYTPTKAKRFAEVAVDSLRLADPKPEAKNTWSFPIGAGLAMIGAPSWWGHDPSLDKFCHCGHERHEGVCGKPMHNGPPPTAPCDCHEFKPVPRVPMATGWYYGRDCRPKDKY